LFISIPFFSALSAISAVDLPFSHKISKGSLTLDYHVSLDVFEGPLDLLLSLIEREELDVTKVSLALVADQYLAHIALLREVSVANLADFLVIAAKLLVIKSRSLLPPVEQEDEEQDIGDQLAAQLLEYKRFKEAARRLHDIEELGLRAYQRVAAPPQLERRLEPGEVTLADLLQALQRALEANPRMGAVDTVVAPVTVHIGDCIKMIGHMVQRYRRVRFSTLIRRARSRLEIIVAFLAILEMTKQQRLRAIQEQPFGEIYLEERQPDPDADIPPSDLSEYGEP